MSDKTVEKICKMGATLDADELLSAASSLLIRAVCMTSDPLGTVDLFHQAVRETMEQILLGTLPGAVYPNAH